MITKEEFKEIRKALDLTQEEFAAKIDLTRVYVGQIERGEAPISEATAALVELTIIKEKKLINYNNSTDLLKLLPYTQNRVETVNAELNLGNILQVQELTIDRIDKMENALHLLIQQIGSIQALLSEGKKGKPSVAKQG